MTLGTDNGGRIEIVTLTVENDELHRREDVHHHPERERLPETLEIRQGTMLQETSTLAEPETSRGMLLYLQRLHFLIRLRILEAMVVAASHEAGVEATGHRIFAAAEEALTLTSVTVTVTASEIENVIGIGICFDLVVGHHDRLGEIKTS